MCFIKFYLSFHWWDDLTNCNDNVPVGGSKLPENRYDKSKSRKFPRLTGTSWKRRGIKPQFLLRSDLLPFLLLRQNAKYEIALNK